MVDAGIITQPSSAELFKQASSEESGLQASCKDCSYQEKQRNSDLNLESFQSKEKNQENLNNKNTFKTKELKAQSLEIGEKICENAIEKLNYAHLSDL